MITQSVRTPWLHGQALTFELSQIIDGLSNFFQGLIHVQCMQVQLENVVDLRIPAAQARTICILSQSVLASSA